MNNKEQSGFGILPIMIVILIVAMSGIGYRVYQQNEKKAEETNNQLVANPSNSGDMELAEISLALKDMIAQEFETDTNTSIESAGAALIMKDQQTSELVNMQSDTGAYRFMLNTIPTTQQAQLIMEKTDDYLKRYEFTHFSGNQPGGQDEFAVGSAAYRRGNEYCYLEALNSTYFEIGCLTISMEELSKQAEILEPYYHASEKNFKEEYPDVDTNFMEYISLNEETRKTVNNTYEVVNGGLGGVANINGYYEVQGGGRILFYRDIGGEWMIGAGSGNGMTSCEAYDTETQRTIYADEYCADPNSNNQITVAAYWQ